MCIKYLRYHRRVLMICDWVVEPLGFYAATNEQKGWERGWRTSRALVDSQIQESREEHALIDLSLGTEDEGSRKAESWKTARRPRKSSARCKSDDEEVTVTELGRRKSGAAQKDKSWTDHNVSSNYWPWGWIWRWEKGGGQKGVVGGGGLWLGRGGVAGWLGW